jgi:hypothetical protein
MQNIMLTGEEVEAVSGWNDNDLEWVCERNGNISHFGWFGTVMVLNYFTLFGCDMNTTEALTCTYVSPQDCIKGIKLKNNLTTFLYIKCLRHRYKIKIGINIISSKTLIL